MAVDRDCLTLASANGAAVTSHGAKVREGQERARVRGVHVGRPGNPKLTLDVLPEPGYSALSVGAYFRDREQARLAHIEVPQVHTIRVMVILVRPRPGRLSAMPPRGL